MEEEYLNFSDYSAEEQKKDAKHAKRLKLIRHAYLMKVDGEWAHFIIGQNGEKIDYYDDLKLPEVFERLKRNFPEYTPRVIQNEGLENYLRDRRAEFKKRRHKQLSINFNKGYDNDR
ncbi:MAG: hypothetical protein IJ545_04625 [Alphaproteobacteria bacterium]|nr:hypothetical protein [Alphaproteobacteria bacterium]